MPLEKIKLDETKDRDLINMIDRNRDKRIGYDEILRSLTALQGQLATERAEWFDRLARKYGLKRECKYNYNHDTRELTYDNDAWKSKLKDKK